MTKKEEVSQFPYATHLNILFPHLEKMDASALADAVRLRGHYT